MGVVVFPGSIVRGLDVYRLFSFPIGNTPARMPSNWQQLNLLPLALYAQEEATDPAIQSQIINHQSLTITPAQISLILNHG